MTAPTELERGRLAYRDRSWAEAHRLLSAADAASPLEPQDLWLLAMSAYLIGEDDRFLAVLERAHHAHQSAGEAAAATRCAFWIGFFLADRGEMGHASGWFSRARRLADALGAEHLEHGYLLLPEAHGMFAAGRYDAALQTAQAAARLAEAHEEADLLALALHVEGRALVRQTRVTEGLALLDEAMVAVAADELSPHVTGLIYCSVISACRDVYALRRAHEWTAALTEWCERQPDLQPYTGHCRVHRSEIMRLHGEWRESIEEARRVSARGGRQHERAAVAAAYYQEAEAQRLLGNFAGAEEAYRQASRLGRDPQPGLALLRMAQGDMSAAAATIRRVLGETRDALRRARLLPAAIEILLASGDLEAARDACEELEQIAGVVRGDFLEAAAAHGRGAVELARGDTQAAVSALQRARAGWQNIEAPYDAGRARELLGLAYRDLGDDDSARLEIEAARATFEKLGATPDVERLASYSRGSERATHGLTPRELEVLGLLATGKTNRAIGEKLFISEKTVARHVSNIFSKLGVSTRAAATAYAYDHQLLGPPA